MRKHGTNKQVLVALLVVAVILSVVATWKVLTTQAPLPTDNQVQLQQQGTGIGGAPVSLVVESPQGEHGNG